MGAIFMIILFGLVALCGLGAAVILKSGIAVLVGLAGGLALFLTFFFGGMQSVPVKSLGVPMAFGTIDGKPMGPGLHFTWQPWMSTVPVDETVQTTTFEGSNALPVRIGGQQSATADATIQWQILPSAAPVLYQDYANQGDLMSTITDNVVVREFKQVVNQYLGDYNPITDVENVTNTNTATSQFTQLGPQILAAMRADIGSKIEIKAVFIPKLTYDPAVENALQSIQQANANFAIATENVKVNTEKARAYTKLGNPTLSQLVAQCITEAGTNAGQCIPGSVTKLSLSGR